MPVGNLGVVFPWEVADAIVEDLTEVATQWRWINRTPFFTRLPTYPVTQGEYHMMGSSFRPLTVNVNTAAAAGDTVLTCDDVTFLMNGDTLELTFADSTVEMMEIVADPNEATSQIIVKRGDAFTTAGAIPANTVLRIVANSRTGGEKWQKGLAPGHWKHINWIQHLDHPVEVSGGLQDTSAMRLMSIAPGAVTPLDAYRMRALGNLIDDFERMIVYQRGMAPTDTDTKRAKTKGFRQQIQDGGGYIYRPVNYGAYTPYDFERDIFMGPSGSGGAPNLFFISSDWAAGLTRWKMPLVRIDMGETVFNVRIDAFESSISPGGIFIIGPLLKPGTLIATRDEDMMLRSMRMPTWYPRGKGGDTWEGDIIARLGTQLNHPDQSRYIEGVAGWAAA